MLCFRAPKIRKKISIAKAKISGTVYFQLQKFISHCQFFCKAFQDSPRDILVYTKLCCDCFDKLFETFQQINTKVKRYKKKEIVSGLKSMVNWYDNFQLTP